MTYPDGGAVSYTYDAMNRMTSVTGLDGDVTAYSYDAAGRRIETSSSTLTTTYRYDSVGNLLEQATSGASEIAFSYAYNRNGYITGETRRESGGITQSSYAYDAMGELTGFLQSTGYGEQYSYDKAGNMTQKVITPSHRASEETKTVTLKMSYNKGNQLTAMQNGRDKIAYKYDKNGNMVQKALSSKQYGKLTDTYAYNALDQLTSYTGYDGYQQTNTYDANGMRLTKAEAGNGERSTLEELLRGIVAGLPEIVEPASMQTNEDYADSVPAGLEWATMDYLYDITQEYYQVIAETSTSKGGSTTTAYAYGLERVAAYTEGQTTRYIYDGRGSVAQTIRVPVAGQTATTALPDVSVKVQSFSYTAFGEQMGGAKVSGFGYNAEAFDAATGMLNLRARLYEPVQGRFNEKDIIRGNCDTPKTLNRYIYALNNPLNFDDPSGMFVLAIAVPLVKAGAGLLGKVLGKALIKVLVVSPILIIFGETIDTTASNFIAFAKGRSNVRVNSVGVYHGGSGASFACTPSNPEPDKPPKDKHKMTTKMADEAAERLGYKRVHGQYSHGQPVYSNGKTYITPDVDQHSGGVWKMAKTIKDLYDKSTRMGTYDEFLNWIGR